MLVIFHIAVALASLAVAAVGLLRPSKSKLRLTYLLTALTFASGFYLVLKTPAHMLQICTEGLIYLGIILAATLGANYQLKKQADAGHSLV